MTSVRLPHHMSATSADVFKDSFASNDAYDNLRRVGWLSSFQRPDFNRALTPPPEMNGITPVSKPASSSQENEHRYGDYMASQLSYRAPLAPMHARDASNAHSGYNALTQPNNSTFSSPKQFVEDDYPERPHQRRNSQPNVIAPSFQIPKAVNDSGGSLSELAAQITCLFWFESSDLLQQIEDSVTPLQLARQLISDARPTTGFRKWVTTILSTTLVAQNVVLLALLFIYRLKKLNPTVNGKPGSEYRLLTVALMLGNKFLDDNTYTNKTWAEVSGINVSEVHIMEVEFLSNMKYCLYTSAEDWTKWQSLLGGFASFLDRNSRPQPPAPIFPPASSIYLPMALPSPPASNQASPPYVADLGQNGPAHRPTPVPSPLEIMSYEHTNSDNALKRGHDGYSTEPPPKRLASTHQSHPTPLNFANASAQSHEIQQVPRLPLPSLPISAGNYFSSTSQPQQLPPLNIPPRAMAMVYPNMTSQAQMAQLSGPSSQPQSQTHSQYHSRQHSPLARSPSSSPTNSNVETAIVRQRAVQCSPTYFLQQRNSPYRPVHNVSTLLYPPPSAALYHRPQSIGYNQMHYQPLGKPIQQRQTGRLPYVAQNVWLDGNKLQAMTPVYQWPSFLSMQQRPLIPQQ